MRRCRWRGCASICGWERGSARRGCRTRFWRVPARRAGRHRGADGQGPDRAGFSVHAVGMGFCRPPAVAGGAGQRGDGCSRGRCGGGGDGPAGCGWRLVHDVARPVVMALGAAFPAVPQGGEVRVRFRAGFGDAFADVPADLQQAVMLLAAHYHEFRHDTGLGEGCMPFGVTALIERFRVVRIGAGHEPAADPVAETDAGECRAGGRRRGWLDRGLGGAGRPVGRDQAGARARGHG